MDRSESSGTQMWGRAMRRRDFLRKSAATVAAGVSAPYFIPSGVLAAPGKPGPNDRIRLGFIGQGGRARQVMTRSCTDADIIRG
jgi:hypothetical protein